MSHVNQFLRQDGTVIPSADLVEVARGIAGNQMILSFSGRDSLACWLYALDCGLEVIPYFCYTVPGLSYDDEMLDYYESYFGTHIARYPHPRTYELFYAGAYHPAHIRALVYSMHLPRFTYADIEHKLAAENGLGDNYLSIVGIRASDNLMRRRLIKQMGPIGLKRRRYYFSIWDWTTGQVGDYLRQRNIKLSKSYLYFGSTGDGVDYNFVKFLRDNLPEDYRRVLTYFPMADIEIFRHEAVK